MHAHVLYMLYQAYHRNMTAPRYVWITPSWYQDNWWKENPSDRNCTLEMMELVINGSLAVVPSGFFPLQNDSAITTSGLVTQTNIPLYTHMKICFLYDLSLLEISQ